MSHYYTDTKKVMNELLRWLRNKDRESWSAFCRGIALRYGFTKRRLEKMLGEYFPKVEIIDDQLSIKKKEQEENEDD